MSRKENEGFFSQNTFRSIFLIILGSRALQQVAACCGSSGFLPYFAALLSRCLSQLCRFYSEEQLCHAWSPPVPGDSSGWRSLLVLFSGQVNSPCVCVQRFHGTGVGDGLEKGNKHAGGVELGTWYLLSQQAPTFRTTDGGGCLQRYCIINVTLKFFFAFCYFYHRAEAHGCFFKQCISRKLPIKASLQWEALGEDVTL